MGVERERDKKEEAESPWLGGELQSRVGVSFIRVGPGGGVGRRN